MSVTDFSADTLLLHDQFGNWLNRERAVLGLPENASLSGGASYQIQNIFPLVAVLIPQAANDLLGKLSSSLQGMPSDPISDNLKDTLEEFTNTSDDIQEQVVTYLTSTALSQLQGQVTTTSLSWDVLGNALGEQLAIVPWNHIHDMEDNILSVALPSPSSQLRTSLIGSLSYLDPIKNSSFDLQNNFEGAIQGLEIGQLSAVEQQLMSSMASLYGTLLRNTIISAVSQGVNEAIADLNPALLTLPDATGTASTIRDILDNKEKAGGSIVADATVVMTLGTALKSTTEDDVQAVINEAINKVIPTSPSTFLLSLDALATAVSQALLKICNTAFLPTIPVLAAALENDPITITAAMTAAIPVETLYCQGLFTGIVTTNGIPFNGFATYGLNILEKPDLPLREFQGSTIWEKAIESIIDGIAKLLPEGEEEQEEDEEEEEEQEEQQEEQEQQEEEAGEDAGEEAGGDAEVGEDASWLADIGDVFETGAEFVAADPEVLLIALV